MNRRSREFRALFAALPASVQQKAVARFRLFLMDANHPALHNHALVDGGRGRHRNGSHSVWVDRDHRAIYVVQRGINLWYWVGSHSDYNIFTGRNG